MKSENITSLLALIGIVAVTAGGFAALHHQAIVEARSQEGRLTDVVSVQATAPWSGYIDQIRSVKISQGDNGNSGRNQSFSGQMDIVPDLQAGQRPWVEVRYRSMSAGIAPGSFFPLFTLTLHQHAEASLVSYVNPPRRHRLFALEAL
jgi:hypothetical protein